MFRVFFDKATGDITEVSTANQQDPQGLPDNIGWIDVEEFPMEDLYRYHVVDGAMVEKPNVQELDAQRKWYEIKIIRNSMLAASDWTENPSVQALHTDAWRTAWAAYRQALRDITEQDINNIVWPTPPDIAN